MRQAGTIATKQDADRFSNYLLSLGVTSKVDRAGDAWAIWVHDENQVPKAKEELELFEREPADPRYQAAEHAAKVARREASEKLRKARKNYIDMRNEWANPWRRRPVTIALVVISVVVFLGVLQGLGIDDRWLYFSEVRGGMPEIGRGQVWRIVTPIFMHGRILHLLFNMYWLFELGTLVERRIRSVRYLLLVLAIAGVSNYAQFSMVGPNFLGMSGVVYGLFGYAWVRGRLDPTCGLYLRPDIAFWLMGWFFVCLLVPALNVANWAHGAGLAAGAALGYMTHSLNMMRQNS